MDINEKYAEWEESERMPIATMGELEMWGITMPGIPYDPENEHNFVTLPWDTALKVALEILEVNGVAPEDCYPTLGIDHESGNGPPPAESLTGAQRDAIHDVHRIHIYSLVLFQEREVRTIWFTNPKKSLHGESPVENMRRMGPKPVKMLLSAQMG